MPKIVSKADPDYYWMRYQSRFSAVVMVDCYRGSTRIARHTFSNAAVADTFIQKEDILLSHLGTASSSVPVVPTTTPITKEEEEEPMTHSTLSATEDCWALVEAILPHSERLLLWGPPGVGKTHIASKHRGKDQFYSITLTEETPAAELRGHFIMKGGDFIWHHGPAIKAWIEGKLLIINEIHKASNDAFSFLLALLDDKNIAALTLPNGETVYPHANFQVIATSNAEPSSLPEALQSRFAVSIEITRPADGAIASLPSDLQEAAKNSATIDDAHRRVGIRSWKAFAHLRQFVGPEVAAKAVFADRSEDVLNSLLIAR